jgi:prepilin-type N-terminal cleavage/methylation domain-containing protein
MQRGFTLIELIIVIVILGVLAASAAPRFLNFQDDANAGVVQGVGSAFKTAVDLVHFKWQIEGGSGPIDNLEVYGAGQATLDINANGWPAQFWPPFEANPQLNNTNDCISVWETLLADDAPTVSTGSGTDFQVAYSANTCTFSLVAQPAYSIFYDSNDGTVSIDSSI